MNHASIALAGLGATVTYIALGFLLFAVLPLSNEVRRFEAVYRTPESMQVVAPVGVASLLVAMMARVALYARAFGEGSCLAQEMRFALWLEFLPRPRSCCRAT